MVEKLKVSSQEDKTAKNEDSEEIYHCLHAVKNTHKKNSKAVSA